MGIGDVDAPTTERRLTRVLQVSLACLAVYGAVTVALGTFGAAAVSLGITFVPALLRREYDYAMHPGLVLWITVAVFLHAVGAAGLYERYQWYDEIAHFVSAALMAAFGYALFRALETHTDEIDVPDAFRGVFIVVFVLSTSIVWEVAEFLIGFFVVYGIEDIATDMVANVVGALVVALAGAGPVSGLVGFFRDRLHSEHS
ncbi:hypothetical protein G9C85_05645 [Halorubellus sp. JP-L1]|uniref:hypothetical protein n=1 Tax=Halorubellus sp. JP-L1 TaxID=2715753 RepID=UPI00140796E3|nr:hypothetical protein [Halorubellus sp. JP-L1]NHN41119.1 hypothetical protein [Halorubellus sp. JP-L1]